jgi:hypothetical protein
MRTSNTTRKSTKPVVKLRVKNEPPGYAEAMVAAGGMSDDPAQQLELAAMLLGIALDPANIKALNAAKPRGNVVDISVRGGAQRTVVVEKRRAVRIPAPRIGDIPVRAFGGQLRLSRSA